jgi:hypothetical protein
VQPHRILRRVGTRRTALLAVTALAMSLAPQVGTRVSNADDGAPTIAFRVVEPDGSPVVKPIVIVSVFGPTYPQVRTLLGGVAGQVVVPFPAEDPVAASRLAAGDSVNLLIRVLDKEPGRSDINATYVTASIGTDAYGTVRELSDTAGKTYALRPGLTEFHPVSKADIGVPGGGIPGGVPYLSDVIGGPGDGGGGDGETPLCANTSNGAPIPCYVADVPLWSYHTNVPIAYNHGAGNDMVSSLRYSSSLVTQTGTAISRGSAGFIEVNSSVSYAHEDTTNLSWLDAGPNQNVEAILDSSFLRERSGWCYLVEGVWQCQYETTYRPYEAHGSVGLSSYRLNDHMDTAQDCWDPVHGGYEPVTKSLTQTSFGLRLGPDENWAFLSGQGTIYANTTITQQTTSGKSFIRKWRVLPNHTYSNHYVYVPYGLLNYNPRDLKNSDCVRAHLGEAQTAAENYDWNNPPPSDTVPPPPSTPPDPTEDENETYRPVCGNMPDRCD